MKRGLFFLVGILLLQVGMAQTKPVVEAKATTNVKRPKLVVGIVVDQMRWDFLYRYYSRYGNSGFKRLINSGFSCENTFIPYTPTVTAAGHTCIYTGSVPAIHGIVGNDWHDKIKKYIVVKIIA